MSLRRSRLQLATYLQRTQVDRKLLQAIHLRNFEPDSPRNRSAVPDRLLEVPSQRGEVLPVCGTQARQDVSVDQRRAIDVGGCIVREI